MLQEIIYQNRDNTIELALQNNGITIDHALLMRVQLDLQSVVLDSNTHPEYFDFTHTDRLIMKFGGSGLAAGGYSARLIIYDTDHPNGLVWGSVFKVVVM